MPEDLEFKSKPRLASDMFHEIQNEGILPFKYIVADTLYGTSPDFMAPLEDIPDITYFVSVPRDTLCWLKMPVVEEREYTYRGEAKTKKELARGEKNRFK